MAKLASLATTPVWQNGVRPRAPRCGLPSFRVAVPAEGDYRAECISGRRETSVRGGACPGQQTVITVKNGPFYVVIAGRCVPARAVAGVCGSLRVMRDRLEGVDQENVAQCKEF